jgi:hypothetical protein
VELVKDWLDVHFSTTLGMLSIPEQIPSAGCRNFHFYRSGKRLYSRIVFHQLDEDRFWELCSHLAGLAYALPSGRWVVWVFWV